MGDASLYVNDADVPAVYYGPAYRTAHSDDERVAVSDLVRAARIYACTIIDFAPGEDLRPWGRYPHAPLEGPPGT